MIHTKQERVLSENIWDYLILCVKQHFIIKI